MNFKSLFVLGAVLCGFASCESSLDEDNLMLSNSTQENVETKSLEGESQSFTLYASYKGMDYTVSCERRNDSIIYLDETFRNLYEKEISKLPNLVTVVHPDGFIEFFDSDEDAERKLGINASENQKSMRAVSPEVGLLGKLILYDDDSFTNTKDVRTFWITASESEKSSHLKDSDSFNDKTSALKVEYLGKNENYCAVLIAYKDDNYRGSKLICIATKGKTHSDSNLDNVPCGDDSWGDKITSFTFSIEEVGKYTQSPHSR